MTNPYSDGRFDPAIASPQPGGGGFAAVGGQQPQPQPGGGGFAAVGGNQPAAQQPSAPSGGGGFAAVGGQQPSAPSGGGGFAAVGGPQITQAQGQTGNRPSCAEIAVQSARHEQEMRQPMNRLGEPVARRGDLLPGDNVAVPGRQPITLVSERADTT